MSGFLHRKRKSTRTAAPRGRVLRMDLSEKKTKKPGRRTAVLVVAGLVLLAAVVGGIAYGVDSLQDVYNEQCRIVSMDDDVEIVTGKMVQPDILTLRFGLTNGANLATIDFAQLRQEMLEKIPNIRALTITRRMPNHVTIEVAEREPVARLAGVSGRVVDEEGVIFTFSRNIATLPVIRDRDPDADTEPGKCLSGHTAAALRLVSAAAGHDYDALRLQEVDASKPDYLLLTLGDYSQAKFAWERMDEDDSAARRALRSQLHNLSMAITSRLGDGTRLWNATVPGRVFANNPDTADR